MEGKYFPSFLIITLFCVISLVSVDGCHDAICNKLQKKYNRICIEHANVPVAPASLSGQYCDIEPRPQSYSYNVPIPMAYRIQQPKHVTFYGAPAARPAPVYYSQYSNDDNIEEEDVSPYSRSATCSCRYPVRNSAHYRSRYSHEC